jgi:hypothetical protein
MYGNFHFVAHVNLITAMAMAMAMMVLLLLLPFAI